MIQADLILNGILHCFPPGLRDAKGKLANAEISAVVFDGDRLIFASDKPIPGEQRSSVFAVGIGPDGIDDSALEYFTADAIVKASKYEDFALTVDERYILATTGFDRIDADSHALNAYNHLLIWPVGEPERVQVVDPDPRDGVEGSLELRNKLGAAIGTDYYKIEGLAAIPADQGDGLLLFGVREMGDAHDDFAYVARIVGAHYQVNTAGNLEFLDKVRVLYDFDPRSDARIRRDCGLSSLEYDAFHKRLYLMTSFEDEGPAGQPEIGGYLWAVSLDNFSKGLSPELVVGPDGAPLEFEHKAEGLAVLDAQRLLVAYDNDRHLGLGSISEREEREACEAPYTLLAMSG